MEFVVGFFLLLFLGGFFGFFCFVLFWLVLEMPCTGMFAEPSYWFSWKGSVNVSAAPGDVAFCKEFSFSWQISFSPLWSLTLPHLGDVFSDFPLNTCKKTPPICYSNRIPVTMYRLTLASTCGTCLGQSIFIPHAEAPCRQLQVIW